LQAYILPVSKQLGEIGGLALDPKGRLVASHRADREWDANSFDDKETFNKKLGPIKNATIAVIDTTNGKVRPTTIRKAPRDCSALMSSAY
ncbi:hypothetical protein OESDEN_19715, partial [Oesophagostomum dentatum]